MWRQPAIATLGRAEGCSPTRSTQSLRQSSRRRKRSRHPRASRPPKSLPRPRPRPAGPRRVQAASRAAIPGPSRAEDPLYGLAVLRHNSQVTSEGYLNRPGPGWSVMTEIASTAELVPELGRNASARPLIDPFQRAITYLRVSVTDRCDFRCVYCMSEHMTFLPKADLLTLEELDRLCSAFIARGVRKLRLTGGEPLVRRGIMTLFGSLARHLDSGDLDELTLTTNGSQLPKYAAELASLGVKRINVSLDTLDPNKFRAITRW